MSALGTRDFRPGTDSEEVKERARQLVEAGHLDRVAIRFLPETKIQGRKPGTVHEVDSALASHYCDVIKVAERVDENEPSPSDPNDRAMKSPPRGASATSTRKKG